MDVPSDREEKFLSDRERLLEFGNYSDVVVKIDGEAFNLHKNVLCLSSPFFEKAFGAGMKEAKTGMIELGSDNSPINLRRLIAWIYLQEYDIDISPLGDLTITETRFHGALVHYSMCLIADEFMMPGLEAEALVRFQKSVVDHVAPFKTVATGNKRSRTKIGDVFLEIASEVHVDKDIRHKKFLPVLATVCIDNFAAMSKSKRFVKALTADHVVLSASVLAGRVARQRGWSWM